MKRKLRVLVLLHPDLMPPDSLKGQTDKDINVWKTEYDVVSTLRAAGHEVMPLGVQYELKPIRDAIEEFKADVAFNLLEQFHGETAYDTNVASYLELLKIPYTGCNPRGLMLARGKALSKKLVAYHRIPVPAFAVFPMRRKVKRPARLGFPLIVKSVSEDASIGIAQASVVENDEKLEERVVFIHEKVGTDALVEQYIEGRELYVGVIGNDRLAAFPTRELVVANLKENAPLIATERVKHNLAYQRKHGIDQVPAENLPPNVAATIAHLSKRIYRILELTGYARLDYRLSPDGQLYFLEANPNPEIAQGEEFASAAQEAGLSYQDLMQRIVNLGMRGAA